MRKNVVFYVTRQYMKLNKKRTFTTFLGIIFMVLLMTCVFIGKDTAVGYLEEVASQKDGKWHVTLYDVTEKQRQQVEELEEVDQTAVSANYGVTEFAQSGSKSRPYLNVKGYSAKCFDWMNIELKSGRLPEKADEIVISEGALKDGADIGIGDTVKAEYFQRSITGTDKEVKETNFPFYGISLKYGETVAVPQNFPYYEENESFKEVHDYTEKKQELKVVGIIKAPGFEQKDAASYTAIAMLGENEVSELAGFNLSVKLHLEKLNLTYAKKFKDIAGERELEFNDYVLSFSGNSADSTINRTVSFLTIFFVAIIMFASVFLIYNVFNMSFDERSRYLGMLSSVGATGRQKRSSIYYEAFFLLLFALPVGILSGLGVVKLGMLAIQPLIGELMSLGQYIVDVDVTLSISWKEIAVIVMMSVVTVLVSACLPARKIGKIGPIECIRGNADKKQKQHRMRLTIVRRMGAEGMLAGNTLKQQTKKTRAITAAAVVFMVIMLVTAFGATAIEKAVDAKIGSASDININAERWDYTLIPYSSMDEYTAVKEEIEGAEGVAETTEWYSGMFVGEIPAECYSQEYWRDVHDIYNLYYRRELSDKEFREMVKDFYQSVNILAVDSKTMKEIAKITGTDLEKMESTEIPAAIVMQNGVLSTKNTGIAGKEPERYRFYDVERMTDKKVGESLPVELYSSEKEEIVEYPIQIAGYATNNQLKDYVSFRSQYLWLIVNKDTAKQMIEVMAVPEEESQISPELYIRLQDKNAQIIDKLRKLSDEDDSAYFLAKTDYQATIGEAIVSIVRILLICFVLLTSVICLLNLFNSIRSRVNGRDREFAIMESVGMTRKQIEKMLLYESMGIVIKSILFAGLIAFPLIYLIQYGVTKLFGPMSLHLPWLYMVLAVLITVLVVIVLTKYCYHKEKHETILERIRNESI